MSQIIELKVGMSCQGCVGAVKRVLGKMEGVDFYDIDLENQKVTVNGNVQPQAVLQTVAKTGKPTSFWETTPEAEPATEPESEPEACGSESKPIEPVVVADCVNEHKVTETLPV